MAKENDDLEAVRQIVEALKPFKEDERLACGWRNASQAAIGIKHAQALVLMTETVVRNQQV